MVRKERELALNAPWDSTAIGWKIYELWGSYISPLYDWQRGLLRRRQTEQKTTYMKLQECSLRWRPKSEVYLLASSSGLSPPSLVKPTGSFMTGIPADCMACEVTSFNAWCLIIINILLPLLLLLLLLLSSAVLSARICSRITNLEIVCHSQVSYNTVSFRSIAQRFVSVNHPLMYLMGNKRQCKVYGNVHHQSILHRAIEIEIASCLRRW